MFKYLHTHTTKTPLLNFQISLKKLLQHLKNMSEKEIMLNAEIYKFRDPLSFFMICYALSEIKKYSLVEHLYEKFENEIKKSGNEIIGLQTMISICTEKNEAVNFDKYTTELKK